MFKLKLLFIYIWPTRKHSQFEATTCSWFFKGDVGQPGIAGLPGIEGVQVQWELIHLFLGL